MVEQGYDEGLDGTLVADAMHGFDPVGTRPLEDAAHALDMSIEDPEADESRLWVLAKRSEVSDTAGRPDLRLSLFQGLSGRALRRLPFTSIARQISTQYCTMSEALDALSITIDEAVGMAAAGV